MSNSVLRTSIAVLMTSASVSAFADTPATSTEPTVVLDPIVVTVSRTSELASKAPASVSVITKKTIEQNPTQNLSDLLQKDASVYIKQNGGVGQGTDLTLRGAKRGHVLLLKDGAKLNTPNSLTPVYPETLDLSDVDHIEIVKGAASVQYGSDAIGGVIQLVSKAPSKSSVFVTGVGGENESYKAVVGADLVAQNGLYAQVRGQRLETDGTRILNTQSRHQKAGFEQKGYSAKVGFNNERFDSSVSISHNEGVNEYTADYGRTNNAKRLFENQVINAKIGGHVTDSIKLSARYSDIQDNQKFDEGKPNPTQNDSHLKSGDVNAQWQINANNTVLVGISHEDQEYDSTSIASRIQKVKSTGYYAQHRYNSDKFNTQVGVRLEDHDKFGDHVVGQISGGYHLSDKTNVYANIGTAFKAPSLSDMYSNWGGNPNLNPEESISYEIGFKHRLDDVFSFQASAFHTNVKNLIDSRCVAVCDGDWKTTFPVYQNLNIDKAEFTGAELGFKAQGKKLFLDTRYTHVAARHAAGSNKGNDIAYRPRQTLTATAGYDDGVWGVSTSVRAQSNFYADHANTVLMAGHVTADVNAHWNATPNLKLFTSINNFWDRDYKVVDNFGSSYMANRRQANVGVTFKY